MSSVRCPFLHSPSRFCTGKEHLYITNPAVPIELCPIYIEGTSWATVLGVRGGYTLDTFDRSKDPDMHDAVVDWAENLNGSLVLCGGSGRGKTKLALGAWDYVVRNHDTDPPSKFITAAEFAELATLAAQGRDDACRMQDFVGRRVSLMSQDECERFISRPQPAIIFDDLGAQREGRDTFTEYLYRMAGCRSIALITTNMSAGQLRTDYGDRILSRFGDVTIITAKGTDYRKSMDESHRVGR